MEEFFACLDYIEDARQQSKVRHSLKDIVVIVLFATLGNADNWVEIGIFAKMHEEYLRQYIGLRNGVPSHDTIQRVMAMIAPEVIQQIQMNILWGNKLQIHLVDVSRNLQVPRHTWERYDIVDLPAQPRLSFGNFPL